MIFCRRGDLSPFVSSIFCSQHQAAGAHNDRSLPVKNVETIERHDRPRVLALPLKPAVSRVKNYTVRSDRPTMTLVIRETDRADRISRRPRVLPCPTPT